MKKHGYLLVILILLSILFTACQPEDSGLLIVPDEIKAEIETAWVDRQGYIYEWSAGENDSYYTVRYYGTYQGATVCHNRIFYGDICEFTVSEEQFEIKNSYILEVYKDGSFFTVEEAYSSGLLTLEDVQSVAEYHEWFELMYGDRITEREYEEAEPISEKLLQEWNEAWQKADQTSWQWNGKNGYYGTYDGAVVRMSAGGGLEEVGFTVAGQVFVWSHAFRIEVYKDGEFFTIQEAYEKGILSQDDIRCIAEQHKKNLRDWKEGRYSK